MQVVKNASLQHENNKFSEKVSSFEIRERENVYLDQLNKQKNTIK